MPTSLRWRKSSHSGTETACVEVAAADRALCVRDSKDPAGPVLSLPPEAWVSLTKAICRGALDPR
ncbi:DUF397 domain-containing protein [Spirillospora sp. CA-294931]|uniref:DUF397 domain-containing protein n=1 Tax=Spirillospora sp. CA-294931 TaxID=3240042 RepID=UPI003D8BF864